MTLLSDEEWAKRLEELKRRQKRNTLLLSMAGAVGLALAIEIFKAVVKGAFS
jgi:hypothetical protein